MFKFFRKYNSWLLAVGVTVLMVVFLIQGTLPMLHGDPGKQTIGTINGHKVILDEQRQAASDLKMIDTVSPRLGSATPQDPLRWMLMQREAAQLGVSASQEETDQLLAALEISPTQVALAAQRLSVPIPAIRQALHGWVVVRNYRDLIEGLGHDGSPRISGPLLEHFLQDLMAKVKITAVRVPASRYFSKATAPDDKEIQDRFAQGKDKLPGDGPFGLGYRTPDRIKIEYLALPSDRLKAKVDIDEAEILSYYDAHRDDFRPAATTQSVKQSAPAPENPTSEARAKIVATIREQKAGDLGDRMMRTAMAALNQEASGLDETSDGYRTLPPNWKPISLETVAEQLQKQYGVLSNVTRIDDHWLTGATLSILPGIGSSILPIDARQTAPIVDYVFSAREFSPPPANPLAVRRLQAGLPSQMMVGEDGSRYVFRLTTAEPARSPEKIDEVRDQVVHDARMVKAFEMLLKERDQWLRRLDTQTPDSLASELGTTLVQPAAFPRRHVTPTMSLEVPEVEGVGKDHAFVDRVFELARSLTETAAMAKASPVKRTDAIPGDVSLSLYLVRIDDYQPMTRADFDQYAGLPQVPSWIFQSIMADAHAEPFTLKSIAKRIGYVASETDKKKDQPSGDEADY